jgi:DNA-damage-inducible protein J
MKKHRYNAETEAAMQESQDIISGKIKRKGFATVAEMNAALDAGRVD